jgi:Skp family chaperone for outer membrane proteins|tara:strand:- start:125 stop:640 length:516 start_codon:yes stop_codon:yes gene_type:complete
MKKIIFITILFLSFSSNSFADNPHFIDFTKVLNISKPGAAAQKKLKQTFKTETEKFNKLENDIRKEESEIISQRKTLKPEEYQKKVETLRKKIADLQKNKQTSFSNIAKSRNKAKAALLKAINPIIKKYMEDNKVRVVLDKKSVIMGDTTLEITDKVIAILNKEVPSLKIN